MRRFDCLFTLVVLIMPTTLATRASGDEAAVRDAFEHGSLDGWRIDDGAWQIRDGIAKASGAFGRLTHRGTSLRDVAVTLDVAYVSDPDAAHAAAGVMVRLGDHGTGYAACVRELERGTDPVTGPWERPVVQLYRMDADGWKLLQESKVQRGRSGEPRALKIEAIGPALYVFYDDLQVPTLREFDDRYVDCAGGVALFKDHRGSALFDNVVIAAPDADAVRQPPSRVDWSAVRGAVYVRSDAVNSVEMWADYWDHVDLLDRELAYASAFGLNMVQAYLHFIVWQRDGDDYLKKVDDFMSRAARHGLKVNLILWDDCGHVEPSLTFAAPVPGRHNAQMMPNPSHRIRDSRALFHAHVPAFRAYVTAFAARFKDDERLAFWQLYNEAMGPREHNRDEVGDDNINRLMALTRDAVKSSGTRTPVTATGGGFYGPRYADFYTYHAYANAPDVTLPNADAGPEHLCTETLNRPGTDVRTCLRDLAGKGNGFIAWELMIGRDNCRFPWGHPDGNDEPTVPFHGLIYPDGHPWSVDEVRALMADDVRFAALTARCFSVEYFDGRFARLRKTSITPRIDFDLGDEPGTGSPDASAGIGTDDFSIRWTGSFVANETTARDFIVRGDGEVSLWIGDRALFTKASTADEARGPFTLVAGQHYGVRVDYVHDQGASRVRLSWEGDEFERHPFELRVDPE